jgi:deazaflavin-dependent oxidoreductase (nitroreductase family)
MLAMSNAMSSAPEGSPATSGLGPLDMPPVGTLTEPPALSGGAKRASDLSRAFFRIANRTSVVPLHRAGLAAWLGSPLTGWQCLLTTRGRRSGLPRPTPLGYIVMDGAAWVMAGYGPRTQWFRNVLEDPGVELRLPGRRPLAALAEEVRDPDLRARVIPPLCRSMAVPGMMIGCLPATSGDERILGCVSWVPLMRIQPVDGQPILPGPDDPGGRGWVWRQGVLLGATAGLVLLIECLRRG